MHVDWIIVVITLDSFSVMWHVSPQKSCNLLVTREYIIAGDTRDTYCLCYCSRRQTDCCECNMSFNLTTRYKSRSFIFTKPNNYPDHNVYRGGAAPWHSLLGKHQLMCPQIAALGRVGTEGLHAASMTPISSAPTWSDPWSPSRGYICSYYFLGYLKDEALSCQRFP